MDSSQACTIVLLIVCITACLGQECEPRKATASCSDRSCSEDRRCTRVTKTCECVEDCGWSCVPVGCRSLITPENGLITYEAEDRSIGSSATFSCLDGYTLSGNAQLECLTNKTWSATNDASCVSDCQRDVEQVQMQGGRCMRQCSDDTDCRNNRECVCDDICGLSCIRTALQEYCNVSTIQRENVIVELNRDTAVFGSVATITCSPGYVPLISGETELQLSCLGNKKWSGESLICIPEDACRDPPEFDNAKLEGSHQQYYPSNSFARYTCDPGYALTTGSRLMCTNSIWSTSEIRCQAVSCGHPGEIHNGRVVETVYTFPNSISYECFEGFKLSSSSKRYCQSTQTWSGQPPTCVPVRCPEVPEPSNGQKLQSGRGFGDQITFSCNEGFSLYGEPVLTCQNDETWSFSAPTCTGYCPTPDEDVLWTFNGNCQGDAEQPNGCGLSYECEGNLDPVNKGIIWSCEGGDWNRKSAPECQESSCNSTDLPLTKVVQGKKDVIDEVKLIPDDSEDNSSPMTTHDDDSTLSKVYDNYKILKVKCPDDLETFGPSKILRCVNGKWKTELRLPYCKPRMG